MFVPLYEKLLCMFYESFLVYILVVVKNWLAIKTTSCISYGKSI